MNEEEKKAIKDSKDIIKELNKNKDKDFIGRLYYKNKPIEDILQILLNLIEKQQKEIKELKEKERYWKSNAIPTSTINTLYISKDKIKEKIEELENTYDENNKNDYHNQFIVDCVAILEELLGE